MKKISILFASAVLSLGAFAQQVPNGGFENWNDSINPIGWNTLANAFGPAYTYFATQDTSAQAHVEGHITLKMTTSAVPGQGTLRSYVGLGTINAMTGPILFSGTPYTAKPDTLYLAYAYFGGAGPATADTALVQIDLLHAGASLFGGAHTFALPPSNGGFLAFPLTSLYTVSGTPDTLSIVFKSGKSAAGTELGSTLYVDAVHFDGSVNVANGINDINTTIAVNAYPNPANSTVNIVVAQHEIGSHIQMVDMAGREVYNGNIASATTAIDTRNMATGIYSIRVYSTDKMTTYKGKISIAH